MRALHALTGILCGSLACLALIPSCGEPAPTGKSRRRPGPPAVRRLELVPAESAPFAPELVASLVPGDPARPWRRKRERSIDVVKVDGRTAAHVEFDTPVSARVDIELETTSFDRIEVDARVPEGQKELIRVSIVRDRTLILVSEILTVTGTGEFETHSFPLAGIERLDVRTTELSIQVAGDATWTELAAMRVLNDSPASLLPPPGGPPELINFGAEARRGWGLDGRLAATAELVPVGRPPARVHLAYAVHPGGRDANLLIERPGAMPTRIPLFATKPGWREHFLPFRGGPMTFRVEEPDGHRLAWTAIAELQCERILEPEDAPIVLLITSDTHRGDHLSRGGTPGLVHTPVIDGLGAGGVQFTNAFAPSNMTNPSHVGIMTGISPRDTRIVGNRAPLAEHAETLAERFQAAGWATAAAVSVQHIGHAYSGLGQGFDRFNGLEERRDYRFGRRDGTVALELAREWTRGRRDVPLFLWVHVFDVHAPYAAPDALVADYLAETRRPVDPALDPVPTSEPPRWITQSRLGEAEVTGAHARYRGAVDRLDGLLAPLLEEPRVRRGVVAFTSDHGEAFGRNRMWWTHHGLYRDQLHVPLILQAPDLPVGLMLDRPVSLLDLGSTLLNLAGLDARDHPGRPLSLDPEAPAEPRFALGYSGQKAAIEHEGWLLVLNLEDHRFDKGPRNFRAHVGELYYLPDDPGCANNLRLEERKRFNRLQRRLIRWLDEADADGFATAFNVSQDAQKRLVELGYAGNAESTRAGSWYTPPEPR